MEAERARERAPPSNCLGIGWYCTVGFYYLQPERGLSLFLSMTPCAVIEQVFGVYVPLWPMWYCIISRISEDPQVLLQLEPVLWRTLGEFHSQHGCGPNHEQLVHLALQGAQGGNNRAQGACRGEGERAAPGEKGQKYQVEPKRTGAQQVGSTAEWTEQPSGPAVKRARKCVPDCSPALPDLMISAVEVEQPGTICSAASCAVTIDEDSETDAASEKGNLASEGTELAAEEDTGAGPGTEDRLNIQQDARQLQEENAADCRASYAAASEGEPQPGLQASLKQVWELQDAIAARVEEIEALQQAEDYLACLGPNAWKAQLLAQVEEALATVAALATSARLCAGCGLRKPSRQALQAVQEVWYSRNCGYCGRGAVTSRKLVKLSMLSRVCSEMDAVCRELQQSGVNARALKPYRDTAKAARDDLQPQAPKQLRCRSSWRASALCGQLQRSRSIVPSKFRPGYDKALRAMGCE